MATGYVYTRKKTSSGYCPNPIISPTQEDMETLLVADNIGKIVKYVGETGEYEQGALYLVEKDYKLYIIDNGTYLTFNDKIDIETLYELLDEVEINSWLKTPAIKFDFTANGENFEYLGISPYKQEDYDLAYMRPPGYPEDIASVYNGFNREWNDARYKTIMLNQDIKLSEELYLWFSDNATLSSEPPEIEPEPNTIPAGTVIKFNDVINLELNDIYDISFTDKADTRYTKIIFTNNILMRYYRPGGYYVDVFGIYFYDERYKTITITYDYSGELVDWLLENSDLTKDKMIYKEV